MANPLNSPSDQVKKALLWFSEMVEKHPDSPRKKFLQEAEIRFDLSPVDCAFLEKNFSQSSSKE